MEIEKTFEDQLVSELDIGDILVEDYERINSNRIYNIQTNTSKRKLD